MAKRSDPIMVREPGGPVSIDLRKLPPLETERLGRTLLEMVHEFYEDPANRKASQEWQRKHFGGTAS